MNPPPLISANNETSPRASVAMTVLGVLFMVGWLTVSAVWFMMSMMGTLMANDSGAASADSHMTLIIGMICGQGMTSLAGICGGMAFFRRSRRRLLLWSFAALLILGGIFQFCSLYWFFSSVSFTS